MKNKIILTDSEKYVIFADIDSKESLYAITQEEQQKKRELTIYFGGKEENVPDEYTVKAYRIGLVDNTDPNSEKYDIIDTVPIEFHINKIYWLWIRIIQSNK